MNEKQKETQGIKKMKNEWKNIVAAAFRASQLSFSLLPLSPLILPACCLQQQAGRIRGGKGEKGERKYSEALYFPTFSLSTEKTKNCKKKARISPF